MSRPRSEQQFGSDSFLDVVCNIVGILIILVVLAGLRASQLPVPVAILDEWSDPAVALGPAETLGELGTEPQRHGAESIVTAETVNPPIELPGEPLSPEEEAILAADDLPSPPLPLEPQDIPRPIPKPVEPIRPPTEFVAAAQALGTEAETLERELSALRKQLEAANTERSTLEARLAALQPLLDKKAAEFAAAREREAASTVAIATLQRAIAELEQQLRELRAALPEGKTIEHRITPVGRTVTGKELHFRVANNQVSVIPLDLLIERLKSQIERRKDWLAKSRQHQGEVGPIDGYLLRYVVQRDQGSMVDELAMGPGVFRISVSQWQLDPQADIVTESAARAVQPGSRFYTALLEADPKTALTFWVYPDSFEAFATLKAFCHSQNFAVAGRPLPPGVKIAGSPTGSRSASQ